MTVSKLVSGQSSLPSQNPTKSFWHTQPSSFLLGHRTTASLPATTDLVIIGSGISGTSAAHYLRENQNGKDLDIVMLEAREACWGATGRNGGHCQPILYSRPVDIGCFEIRNYEAVKALVEEKNIQCDWKSLPSVHAYFTESSFQEAKEQTQAFKSLAPELGNLVTIVTKDSVNPSLAELRVPTAAGVIIQAKAASLWPYKLVAGILEDLLSRNNQTTTSALKGSFNLQTNTPVTHLQKLATAKDHPWIVHTARGMIATKQILLTTNGYTSHLLPSFSDLIVPVRGEMSSLLPPKTMSPINSGANSPLTHTYYFIGKQLRKVHQDDYLVQRPFSTTTTSSSDNSTKGGELMFGGGRGFALKGGVGISDDSEIDPPAAAYLRRELNSMLDVHNTDPELQASMEWSGIMGYSRDRHPWVGKVSTELGGGEGLWICAGYTGHGMPNTHLCGKAVADMILEKKREDIDLPESYWVSEERVVKAKGLEVVAVTEGEEGGS